MSEPTDTQVQPSQADLIAQLRDEFASQIGALKTSFEEANKKLEEENNSLKQQNEDLQRALIRSATVPDEHHVAEPPSEEEIYRKKIEDIANNALKQVKI